MPDKTSFNFLPSQFYDKIVITNDLIKNPLLAKFPTLTKDEFFIAPPKEQIDKLAKQLLKELAIKMEKWEDGKFPSDADIQSKDLVTLLKGKGEGTISFQDKLQQDGYTGIIIQAIAKLNASALAPIDRAILTHKPLAFYAFYRGKALLGGKFIDIEGVISSVLKSLQKIKSYINVTAVERVISSERLNLPDPNPLKDKVKNLALYYSEGELLAVIKKEFENTIDKVDELFYEVTNFVNSGAVTLPEGADKDAVIKKMVEYLIKIGYRGNSQVDPLIVKAIDDKVGMAISQVKMELKKITNELENLKRQTANVKKLDKPKDNESSPQ